jgi:hypothetical protein
MNWLQQPTPLHLYELQGQKGTRLFTEMLG